MNTGNLPTIINYAAQSTYRGKDPSAVLPKELLALDKLITRKSIAKRLGCSGAYVSCWFHGKAPVPQDYALSTRQVLKDVVDALESVDANVCLSDKVLLAVSDAKDCLKNDFSYKARAKEKAVVEQAIDQHLAQIELAPATA